MNTTHRTFPARKLATVLALATAAGITAGCGAQESPEPGAASPARTEGSPGVAETDQAAGDQAASAYTGPYDEDFRADLSSYVGQQVTLTGEVADLVPSRSSLVLTAPQDPDVEPLLVTARFGFPEAEEGAVVEVTGTVQTNFQARVDQDDVDQEAGFYDRHIGEPYLDEATLSTTEPAGT